MATEEIMRVFNDPLFDQQNKEIMMEEIDF